jgi:hypothetical protein
MPEHVHPLVNEPAQIVLAQFPESRSADDLEQAARPAREVLVRWTSWTRLEGELAERGGFSSAPYRKSHELNDL